MFAIYIYILFLSYHTNSTRKKIRFRIRGQLHVFMFPKSMELLSTLSKFIFATFVRKLSYLLNFKILFSSFIDLFVLNSFVVHSFIINSFILSVWMDWLTDTWMHSFVQTVSQPFMHSIWFVCLLFVHSFIHPFNILLNHR